MGGASSRVDVGDFAEGMREEAEAYLAAVMEQVNAAADGEWIAGSEEAVRDLSAGFRRRVFEAAVQGRIDAAEAAFPPSGGDDRRPGDATAADEATGQQGPAENDRADGQRPR